MTKRIHALLFAVLVAAGSGCSPNPGPIYISKFFPLPDDCVLTGVAMVGIFKSGGSLDVAAGAPQYVVGMELSGGVNIIEPSQTGAGQTFETVNRERAIVTEFVITYSATPKIPNLPTKEYHMATNVPFDAVTTVADMGIALLSPEASSALENIDTGKSYRLLVSITGNGYMSGSGSHFTTGPTVYPITAFKGEYTCSVLRTYSSACHYNGQDLSPAASTKDVCCDGVTAGTVVGCP
jgi:hypothetical protein